MPEKGSGEPEVLGFPVDGAFPNNGSLPVLIYRKAVQRDGAADALEQLFAANGWTNNWRNGLYDFDHFHSNAHEVLGIAKGHVTAVLGGPNGSSISLSEGDVVMLPAGTAHRKEEGSTDLQIVGAYWDGREPDLRRGEESEELQVRDNLGALPPPERDPVNGRTL
ncbi:cupin [Terrihabitans rhizophilus]|uniref:Cupin n=1 Tax=Terrihabitans rhizophilus TaxID=3092662 RepID=A0ABU4RNS6_9HYPH|nr:cupin [Terrihabitans sp. PJ23]MDX6806502.1 cupin [Terrihabitans sp. PJ23]